MCLTSAWCGPMPSWHRIILVTCLCLVWFWFVLFIIHTLCFALCVVSFCFNKPYQYKFSTHYLWPFGVNNVSFVYVHINQIGEGPWSLQNNYIDLLPGPNLISSHPGMRQSTCSVVSIWSWQRTDFNSILRKWNVWFSILLAAKWTKFSWK